MKISFDKPGVPATGVAVVFATSGGKLSSTAEKLDKKTSGAIKRAIKSGDFNGDAEQLLNILAPVGTRLDAILVVGLGKPGDIRELGAQKAGGQIYAATARAQKGSATVAVDEIEGSSVVASEMAAQMGFGALLRSYRFDKYRTKEKPTAKPKLKAISFMVPEGAAARKQFGKLSKVADGVFLTRDLVSEPANVIYPETLAKQAKSLEKVGVKVEVLGVAQMKRLGMGALLGVGQGSVNEPRLVVMQWNGAPASRGQGGKGKKKEAPIAFVGKGVTFDTGGISIKPAANMEDMKWDMGGAGVVIGLMRALAGRKAKVNAVGIVGLVENMPSGSAQRPGDIVTSMSGQTIEVLNTDAEGRLVLADALWYCKDRFKPKFMIDLATLTGAIIVSLADQYAGLFSNDDKLCEQLTKSGEVVNEKVWRMPLGDAYDKMINSDAADMKNIGNRGGGSITAAQFLQRFVDKTPWAHLDIAGVTWSKADAPTVPKGGTAFGVRLLDRLVADYYEKK